MSDERLHVVQSGAQNVGRTWLKGDGLMPEDWLPHGLAMLALRPDACRCTSAPAVPRPGLRERGKHRKHRAEDGSSQSTALGRPV